jgi:hypothetical protein
MERLWSRVDKTGDCWVWLGSGTTDRYGQIRVGSKMVYVHRLAYELTYGVIPAGMSVLHRCDNPSCCRPEHLFLGTQQDNIRDMENKGRANRSGLPRQPIKHGTDGGWQAHRKRGEPVCEACRIARNAAQRRRYAKRNSV